jgi:hypothetical protein
MSEWQPIETAPQREVLLLFFPTALYAHASIRVERYPVLGNRKPTHWMPLPDAPPASEPKP